MRDRPRIVHLTTVHHVQDPRIFRKQAQSLRRAGYDVHLVAPHPVSETLDGIPITALPKIKDRLPRLRHAYRAARALNADVYHFHDPELIPVARALKQATQAKVIYDVHEDNAAKGGTTGRMLQTLERWCFRWADHVILAETAYTAMLKSTRVPHTPILNYFLPLDDMPPMPRYRSQPEAPFYLLYAGTQGAKRGIKVMLDLAERIQHLELPWHVHLIGAFYRPALREQALERIRAAHLEPIVQAVGWDGYLPWAEMEPYYRTADVGLALLDPHPNFVHTIPTKFYEYLYYGLPILCSDFPGWQSFIETHQCGAVVQPHDAEAVFRVLRSWAEDPAGYTRLSQAAAAAATQFHWSIMEERLLEVYQELTLD